jgi:mannose-6-phosphate isomerase-like protein (cupin superfamily)
MQSPDAVRNNDSEDGFEGRLVRHLDSLDWREKGNVRWARAFGRPEGTKKLSLYVAELKTGGVQLAPMHESEMVLHILEGNGAVSIAGRNFPVEAGDGIYVRKAEALALRSAGDQRLRVLIAVCPSGDDLPWNLHAESPGTNFDDDFPERVVSSVTATRDSTGDRFFKVLVGPNFGSNAVTQFIGSIPLSKAPEHYHLYEEVICVLSGEGRMWLGNSSYPVRPGSLIFLPRQQPHCLECTVEESLDVLGMFYPAGSPAVNYSTENPEHE